MELKDIAPLEALSARYGDSLIVSTLGLDDLDQISQLKADGVFAFGGHIWHRMVLSGKFKIRPDQLADDMERSNPDVHKKIAKIVNEPVIRDICYVRAWRGNQDDANLVHELLVAELFGDDLHLGDVTVCDLDRPLTGAASKGNFHKFAGLGALATVMDRLKAYAAQQGSTVMTLMAAERGVVPIFERYGYEVEDSEIARAMLEYGVSIPMAKAADH